jgi:predicted dithiol-disulfide oxidoreductase (DUF899 family)
MSHEHRFPNESPEYRKARDELLAAEAKLRTHVEEVAALRRKLPLGGKIGEDYAFEEWGDGSVRPVRLSQLFEPKKDSLFLYSFMYGPNMKRPCPLCTSFLDGLDAQVQHIGQRISVAVAARSPIQRIREFAQERGWKRLRLVSSANNSYHRDYFGEDKKGSQWPMANVFVRRPGGVHHFWGSELLFEDYSGGDSRHIDMMWPLWNVLDTTPEGRTRDFYPELEYGRSS